MHRELSSRTAEGLNSSRIDDRDREDIAGRGGINVEDALGSSGPSKVKGAVGEEEEEEVVEPDMM